MIPRSGYEKSSGGSTEVAWHVGERRRWRRRVTEERERREGRLERRRLYKCSQCRNGIRVIQLPKWKFHKSIIHSAIRLIGKRKISTEWLKGYFVFIVDPWQRSCYVKGIFYNTKLGGKWHIEETSSRGKGEARGAFERNFRILYSLYMLYRYIHP